jgi:hypothetical protein
MFTTACDPTADPDYASGFRSMRTIESLSADGYRRPRVQGAEVHSCASLDRVACVPLMEQAIKDGRPLTAENLLRAQGMKPSPPRLPLPVVGTGLRLARGASGQGL